MIKANIPKDALLLLRITGAASRINKAHPHKLKKMSTFFSIGEPETLPIIERYKQSKFIANNRTWLIFINSHKNVYDSFAHYYYNLPANSAVKMTAYPTRRPQLRKVK